MAFTDWTTEKSTTDAVIQEFFSPRRLGPAVSVGSAVSQRDVPLPALPLDGSGSLRMHFVSANLKGHIYRTVSSNRGFSAGNFRTWCYIPERSTQQFNGGIYAYATSVSLVSGAGAGYLVGLSPLNGRFVFLARMSSGLSLLSGQALLASSASAQWSFSATFTMQFSWASVTSGMQLVYSQGTAGDFSDLVNVLSYTDITPVSGIPVAEGLWMDGGVNTDSTILFDNTR